MTDRTLIAGDAYVTYRSVLNFQLFQTNGDPFPLTSCIVRSTWKTAATTIADDPDDTYAPIKATLIVDGSGSPTTQDKLYLVDLAQGKLALRLTAAETRALLPGTSLIGDIEVTAPIGEPLTVKVLEKIVIDNGITNRTTD